MQTTSPSPPAPEHQPQPRGISDYRKALAGQRLQLPAGLTLEIGVDAADAAEKARKAAHAQLGGLLGHHPELKEPVLSLLVEFETSLRETIRAGLAQPGPSASGMLSEVQP